MVNSPKALDLTAFVEASRKFQAKLTALKSEHPLPEYGWYPYDSLTGVFVLEELLRRDFGLLPPLIESEPVLDIGCADGDLSFFLESLGADVDAIDYSEMNFNQLAGARALRERLDSRANIYSVNLDWYFDLPRARYGLILFLGTLYHIKNPFYVLETLARRGAYCLLSTRIAQTTGAGGVKIEDQPVAYLLDPREANDDPTNFWVFSEAGLLRLAGRAGWSVVSQHKTGCESGSNPVEAAADQRMFLLLKSRFRFPDLTVRLMDGWHAIETEGWRWTAKTFSFEVVLPAMRRSKEFALAFSIPGNVIEAGQAVKLACEVDGKDAGSTVCDRPGSHTFRGIFPSPGAQKVLLQFRVEHGFQPGGGDTRELGVMVSFAEKLAGGGSGLPLRVS